MTDPEQIGPSLTEADLLHGVEYVRGTITNGLDTLRSHELCDADLAFARSIAGAAPDVLDANVRIYMHIGGEDPRVDIDRRSYLANLPDMLRYRDEVTAVMTELGIDEAAAVDELVRRRPEDVKQAASMLRELRARVFRDIFRPNE